MLPNAPMPQRHEFSETTPLFLHGRHRMDPLRRLIVAIQVGSVRAFVGEELARRADTALGVRAEGDALLDWIETDYTPQDDEDIERYERLQGFVAYVRAEGGFNALAAQLREDLGIDADDEEDNESP